MDDFENPGMVFVDAGLESWDNVEGRAGKACAGCYRAMEDGS